MAENLIKSVEDMLKEESWTRAAISSYTQNNLKELADIVEKARSEKCERELLDLCEKELENKKDSIIALYISGMLSIYEGAIDNTSLETLVDIFQKNHKEAIISYLCESILADFPNNKFALRTLADTYLAEGNDKVWELYTQLVKIDFNEADLAKTLAEHYDTEGDAESATEYYKKAILRYINNGNYTACKDIWTKLTQLIPEEFDFFQMVRRKISKAFGDIKTTTLMQELYNWYKDNGKWETAITILKQNLEIEPKDTWARKEITDCYRAYYKDHSQLEDYIRSSNLTQNYRNVFEAINDFEKHIAFDKGGYVFHRNWGVGIIRQLDKDSLKIFFGAKTGTKEMTLKMAVTALKPLSKEHIWVLKATKKKEELSQLVKKDKVWTLKTIITSFDNNCDFKRIKAELVPSILSPSEWTSWNTAAKKELETNSIFGVNPNDIAMYMVRENKLTIEEKLSNEFKAQKLFFARIDILMKYFYSDETDKSSELFTEMYSYFTGYLKNISKVNEQVIAAYLIVNRIGAIDSSFAFQTKDTFDSLYRKIENPKELYENLKDSKNTSLRKDFLESIKMLPDWDAQYIRLFPTVLDKSLLQELINADKTSEVQDLVRTAFENFKDYRETVIFFFKDCQKDEWFQKAGVPYEKQLITLINIIELTFREINNHVRSTENKKINKSASQLLFDDKTLIDYMMSKDEATVKKMYTLIDDIADIDPSYKEQIKPKIMEKYPDFVFRTSGTKTTQQKGMIVTAAMLEIKKAEIDRLQNVEIPANAKEIADAREKGDLKENAEYKSAKEKQHMLNLTLTRLQEELNRATVFDPTTATNAIVSFGTKVTLHNNDANKDETFTILGPWESDPDNNIRSYLSPFGIAVMDKKVGDSVIYKVDNTKHSYTVKAIEKAKI